MAIRIWKRPYTVRRFSEPQNVRGYVKDTYTDMTAMLDVQMTDDSAQMREDGDAPVMRLKAFGDLRFNVADRATGAKPDWLWFDGKWFECRSSRLSRNTFIKHWTSSFVECLNQADPPEEYADEDTGCTGRDI